jgi:ADP-heptose:LPS heptosyltransferase
MTDFKGFRLEDADLAAIAACKGENDTDKLKKALKFARIMIHKRKDRIIEMQLDMQTLDISFEDLGSDYKAARDEEARELLQRLRTGLKQKGKAALNDLLGKEYERYGVETRGGNTGKIEVQNPPIENTHLEEKDPIQ